MANDVTISIGADISNIKSQLLALTTGIGAVAAAFTAAFAGVGLIRAIESVTEAASKQDDAINKLNTSLKLAGSFSEEASQEFQDFASSLQEVTTVGDETTLELAALARNFTKTNEQAQDLTKAALDLSAATGISLEGAVKNLGKTFAGLTGELGESIPELRNLTEAQLRAGDAIKFVNERFGGAAAALRNTFSGAVQAATNDYGDFLEELGKTITQNPAVIEAIKALGEGFKRAGTFVKDNKTQIIVFINEGIIVLIGALETLANAFIDNYSTILQATKAFFAGTSLIFNNLKQGLQGITLAVVELARSWEFYRSIINFATGDTDGARLEIEENRKALAKLSDFLKKDIVKTAKDTTEAFDELIKSFDEIPKANNNLLINGLKLLVTQLQEVKKAAQEANDELKRSGPAQGNQETPGGISGGIDFITTLTEEFSLAIKRATDAFIDATTSFVENFLTGLGNIAVIFKDTLVSGAKDFSAKSRDEQNKIAKESAQTFVANAAGALTDAFLPGAGQFVTALLELAKDPESFRQFIDGFARALPEVITALVDALPLVFDAIIDNLPAIIDAFIDAIPEIIDAIIEALPRIIAVLIENAPRIAVAFVTALIDAIPDVIAALTIGISEGLKAVFANLIEDLKDVFGGGGGGTLGKFLGGDIQGGFQDIGNVFSFADGGVVPPGFPNDTFPAKLTSGEVVLNADQQAALAGPQSITVNLVLNEDTLASTILELNRDNRRIA